MCKCDVCHCHSAIKNNCAFQNDFICSGNGQSKDRCIEQTDCCCNENCDDDCDDSIESINNTINNMLIETPQQAIDAMIFLGAKLVPLVKKPDFTAGNTTLNDFMAKLMDLSPEQLEHCSKIVVIDFFINRLNEPNLKAYLRGLTSIILTHALHNFEEEERNKLLSQDTKEVIFQCANKNGLNFFWLLSEMYTVKYAPQSSAIQMFN